MKPYHTRQMLLALSALAGFAVQAAELETTQPESTQPVAAKTNGEKWWNGNCERILADIKKMNGEIDVGIGGDRTQNVLWRLENGELDGYKAKLFVVMIGTNNLWDKNAEPVDVAAGIKAILDLIQTKQPQAKILLLSIFPRGEKPNPGRDKITAINELISKYAGGPVQYMDISAKFLEADDTISKEVMHDSLHLAPKGYDIWAEAIGGKVKEIVSETPSGQNSATQP